MFSTIILYTTETEHYQISKQQKINVYSLEKTLILIWHLENHLPIAKGVVNCQNSRDKGPPEGNSARG